MSDRATRPFTSDFSVTEFALAHAAELEPRALVQGCASSLTQVAVPPRPIRRGELSGTRVLIEPVPRLGARFERTRALALAQVARHAEAVGANAVVGLYDGSDALDWPELVPETPTQSRRFWLRLPLMYRLTGTAVREPQIPDRRPRLATLTAGDVGKLRGAGWETCGVVTATSFQVGLAMHLDWGLWNADSPWTVAREAATARLRTAAAALGGRGVVGISEIVHHREFHISLGSYSGVATARLCGIELTGTAIRGGYGRRRVPEPPPMLVLR